jgi:hypothetical protein
MPALPNTVLQFRSATVPQSKKSSWLINLLVIKALTRIDALALNRTSIQIRSLERPFYGSAGHRTSIQAGRTSFQGEPYPNSRTTVLQRKSTVLQINGSLLNIKYFNDLAIL